MPGLTTIIPEPLPYSKGQHLKQGGLPLNAQEHDPSPHLSATGVCPRPSSPVKERKVVADDFMYDFKYNVQLPTTDRLQVDLTTEKADPVELAQSWLSDFARACERSDSNRFANLFLEDGVWRDKLVFTWDYRSFNGRQKIRGAAADLLATLGASEFKLLDPAPKVETPYPDLKFIQAHFAFRTKLAGGSAVVNLVRTGTGIQAWTLHTAIESLNDYPEMPNRDGHMVGSRSFHAQREYDIDNVEPEVIVIGGGHNGLMMAARLQYLGVKALIIERNERIGDNWRHRYEALSLHFPHWGDHLPYMPYPEHWPEYTPAAKMGDWLETYANAMELHYWTSSRVVAAKQDPNSHEWTIEVERAGQTRKTFHVKHLVMATSLAGVPMLPSIDGMSTYKGVIRHSTQHDSSRAWVNKRALVVGTSSSGFDTAYDFARRGIDVTLLQRSPTYIMSLTHSVPRILGVYEPKPKRPDLDAADRIAFSMPVGPGEELGRRLAKDLAILDKDIIEGMERQGFKTYMGQRETGTQTLGYTRNGGFYFDAGACDQIINGNIKVRQGYVSRFTPDKVVFNEGPDDFFDIVVMATGFSNTIESVRATLGSEVADRCGPIWGMDEEGELKSAYKYTGVPNFWLMVGTFQHGRYHTKKIAMKIKAQMEGIAPQPYNGQRG